MSSKVCQIRGISIASHPDGRSERLAPFELRRRHGTSLARGVGTPPRWCRDEPRLGPHPPWLTRAWMAASPHEAADAAAGGSWLVRAHVRAVPRHRRLT